MSIVAPDCDSVMPGLSTMRYWRESADGTVTLSADGKTPAVLFGPSDGVAYEVGRAAHAADGADRQQLKPSIRQRCGRRFGDGVGPRGVAEGAEDRSRGVVGIHPIFRMPLHADREGAGILDGNRLDRAVLGDRLDLESRAEPVDAPGGAPN